MFFFFFIMVRLFTQSQPVTLDSRLVARHECESNAVNVTVITHKNSRNSSQLNPYPTFSCNMIKSMAMNVIGDV